MTFRATDDSDQQVFDHREWRREIDGITYLISTDRALLDSEHVNKCFALDDMPWAKPLPAGDLKTMLDNSITLALYTSSPSDSSTSEPSSPRTPSPTLESAAEEGEARVQMGFARLVTDRVTFVWVTDVYVEPQWRRLGLARWLMACTKEVIDSVPALRRTFLVTSLAYGKEFYGDTLGMYEMSEEKGDLVGLTRSRHGKNAH